MCDTNKYHSFTTSRYHSSLHLSFFIAFIINNFIFYQISFVIITNSNNLLLLLLIIILALEVNLVIMQPQCFRGNDGRIAVSAYGGMGTYTYAWYSNTSLNIIPQPAPDAIFQVIPSKLISTFQLLTL